MRGSINRRDGFNSEDDLSDAGSETVLPIPSDGFESEHPSRFKYLPTVWVLALEAAVFLTYEVILFLNLPVEFYPIEDEPQFLFLTLLHIGLFLLIVILNKYIDFFHHRVRYYGYLDFYRSTKTMRKIPFVMLSVGNAILLTILCLWDEHDTHFGLERVNILQILFTFELILSLPSILVLIIKTVKFNRKKAAPDAAENLVPGFETTNSSFQKPPHEIGFNEQDYIDEVMEKQGDMIKYLQQQNQSLSMQIVHLTETLKKSEQGFGLNETDLQYLLRSKEQELRLALGEKNQIIKDTEEKTLLMESQIERISNEKAALQKEIENNQKEIQSKEKQLEEAEKMVRELRNQRM